MGSSHGMAGPSSGVTGYSIDMTPPDRSGGDVLRRNGLGPWGVRGGLQRRGGLFEWQLQFSAWDAADGTEAEVVDQPDGTFCHRFGHEGNGVQCSVEYPWSVGQTYRFEITEVLSGGNSHVSLRVTDLATGDERFIGTLSRPGAMANSGLYLFNEDFRRTAPTCLDQPVRAVAFRRAMVRTSDMRWVPATRGRAAPGDEDAGTPALRLRQRRREAGSPRSGTGDGRTTISNPHASQDHAIPR